MFRPLRSCIAAVTFHRAASLRLLSTGVALGILVGTAAPARSGSFDGFGEAAVTDTIVGDGLSSVIVSDLGQARVIDRSGGDGWIATDAEGGPGMSFAGEACPPEGPCPDAECPPWNGVPGLVNRCLGDACPRIVFSVDALMLWQGNAASRPLFLDPGTGLAALDVNQINAPVSVGPRLNLIVNVTQCDGIEANWFDVQPFEGVRDLPQGPAQYEMNNLAGMTFADIDSAFVTTSAAFKSFELNWRRRTCTPFTWLAGFRWVEWDQTLDIVDTYTDSTDVSGTDAASMLTGNNLYGGQVGVDALLWNTGRWLTFNGIAKAGVFANYQAFQRTDLLGDREFGSFSSTANGTAFVGEVGVNGTVQILSWLYWRAGYNFFWLTGVAVPASQLSITNQPEPPTTALNLDGSVFLHGVNTGLEARW